MGTKELLVVFPSPRDLRYLASPKIAERCRVRYLGGYVENPRGFDPVSSLREAKVLLRPDGVIATEDHPAAFVASILAREFNLPGPSPESVLLCQHKYYSRVAQRRAIPEAVPPFGLIPLDGSDSNHSVLPFPFFLKPVKGVLSILAGVVDSTEDLRRFVEDAVLRMPPFAEPFDRLVEEAGLSERYPLGGNHLIGEEILQGDQVTLEGYVFQGETHLIDIVDSIFYPGTRSFERFQAPSKLPRPVQERMLHLACRFVEAIDFSNGIFNLEFVYEPRQDSIHLIEANSRMAHQFAGMMEAIHGTNPYEILADLSFGIRPRFKRHGGANKTAASFVLRKFSDAVVTKVPTDVEIRAALSPFPFAEIEILAKPGRCLSDYFRQDEESYRYAIVNLAASSEAELLEKFREMETNLPFEFAGRIS